MNVPYELDGPYGKQLVNQGYLREVLHDDSGMSLTIMASCEGTRKILRNILWEWMEMQGMDTETRGDYGSIAGVAQGED